MKLKKALALALAFALSLSLAACGGEKAKPSEAPGIYTAGTYTADAAGMNGPVKVSVTVSTSAITEVKVTDHAETAGLGDKAIDPMIAKIMEKQSTEVDAEAGATMTSDAIKSAVQKCLNEAMGVSEPATTAGYSKPGTYTATAKAHNGDMVVEVTFDEKAITAVKIGEHKETYGLGYGLSTSPIEVLPAAIVKAQSLAVDSVSSATITSAAIKAAVADCATQAGGDAEALKSAPVEKPAGKDETYDVDVAIVGAGAAGLAAANTALEAGAKVIILEKVGVTGGSTTRSGGKILAAGTPWQTKQDFTDNADMMYDYLMSFDRGVMDAELVRLFCDDSAENLQWLEDRGVKVKDVEPIHSSLTPWRVHNTEGGGGMISGIGGQICVPLTSAYEKAGGQIVYNCRADKLLTDAKGAVTGVSGVKADGGTVTVNAKGVILATGGYAHNKEMMAKYAAFLPDNSYSGVPTTNVGDGLVMAQAVGAKNTDALGLQLVFLNYDAYIGIAEESGLIVDYKGNRVVNEYSYQSHVAQGLADAKSPYGYYIATANDTSKMVQYGMTMDKVPHAATIEELAAQINMDPAALKATVDRYNKMCAQKKDEDFGKPADYLYPVEGDMYYAFMMNSGSSVTFGGLSIDSKAQVLDTKDQPIPGLYAAGEVAFDGLFAAEYPCCGMAIGSAVYYGRIAADSVL
ncbi:MAG: FAD-dependent oxidoreductase, partial [Pseudoflavonifractor sp.]